MLSGTTVTSHAYTLDPEGNRTRHDEFLHGITPVGQTERFDLVYDGLNRLLGVSGTNPESFSFDQASNVASRTGPSATNTYDLANRQTGDGTRTFVWNDADTLASAGSETFSYDPLFRITFAEVDATSSTGDWLRVGLAFSYNGDGLLRSRAEGQAQKTFLWDTTRSPEPLLQAGSDRVVYGLGPLYLVKSDGTTVLLARDGSKSVRAEISGGRRHRLLPLRRVR